MVKEDCNLIFTRQQVAQIELSSRKVGLFLAKRNREAAIAMIDDFFSHIDDYSEIEFVSQMGLDSKAYQALDRFGVISIADLLAINWRNFFNSVSRNHRYLIASSITTTSRRLRLVLDFSTFPKNLLSRL